MLETDFTVLSWQCLYGLKCKSYRNNYIILFVVILMIIEETTLISTYAYLVFFKALVCLKYKNNFELGNATNRKLLTTYRDSTPTGMFDIKNVSVLERF
jgi:hypothetical protein